MTRPILVALAALLSSFALGALGAVGQEPPPLPAAPPAAPPIAPTEAAPAAGPPAERAPLELRLPWTTQSGQGFALSYENGAFGQAWEQGLRLHLQLAEHFAVNVRPMMLMQLQSDANPTTNTALGGRLEFIGRSAVLLNLIRVYGGGGGGAFVEASGPHQRKVTGEGGGQFGVEFFMVAHSSFYLEIGGNGCSALSGTCAGATAVAGMNLYVF